MSLIGFHRFLISTAILFCGGFAIWEFLSFAATGSTPTLILGIFFGLAAGGLGYYLANLARFLDRKQTP